jgi:hypothetical protein
MIKSIMELRHFFLKNSSIFRDENELMLTFTFDTETKARIAADMFSKHVANSVGTWKEVFKDGVVRQLAGVKIKFAWSEKIIKINAGEV